MESSVARAGGIGHLGRRGPHSALPSDIRKSNRAAVLKALYPDQWRSRADLAKITGLSKVSVSDVVGELIEAGLLVEGGYKSSSRPGKPAVLVGINAGGRGLVAVDLSEAGRVSAILADLTGKILESSQIDVSSAQRGRGHVGDRMVSDSSSSSDTSSLPLEPVIRLCRTLIGKSSVPMLGVGVATPGTVSDSGEVLAAPNLGWTNLKLADELRQALDLPVFVSNDADSAVFGERCFGAGPANMILVQLARGVGAGVLIDDHIVRGTSCVAGEIGHVVIDENGMACACGKRGCLETMTSIPFLRQRLADAEGQADRDDVLAQAGEVLGAALSMPVAMTNITDIAISGPEPIVGKMLLESVENTINDRVHSRFIDAVIVHATRLGTNAALLGGVACVLRHELGVL
ncbi:ROK family transcriptional regulator [Bifidobacterium aemilianum]|nr:ROK family transcriptional regulator [Bifidobacterium aemilianum]